MGWSKRTKGTNFATGIGASIGEKTGKIVGYGTKSKRCVTCEVARREKRPPHPHDCRKNHFESSKSMEPAVSVELAKSFEEQGAHLACLVGDDDASMYKRLVEEIGDVAKHSDIGHVKRGLGSKLLEMKTKNKNCKQLSATVISYMQKMFAYALHSNAGNPDGLKVTLAAVIPHAYGDHSQCSIDWCGYLKAPGSYKHSGLPHGKDLTCQETWRVLANLFVSLAGRAESLAPLGSCQANESFNNIATSKAQSLGITEEVTPKILGWLQQSSRKMKAATAVAAGWSPSKQATHRGGESRCLKGEAKVQKELRGR